MRKFLGVGWTVGFVLVMAAAISTASAQWEIKSDDGNASIKFGFLAQMKAEAQDTADGGDTAQDLYFRRLRILVGGKMGDGWTYFFETDSPNLGKGESDGTKGAGDVYIQDFFVSYSKTDKFRFDAGMILIPLAHNSTQSAATLMPVDYGPYSFLNSGPTDSRVGRDYGVQIRGHLAKDHFEYRLGAYQGQRGTDSTNQFRYAGRVVWYPFEADKGVFYTGTTLGKKHILAIGAGADAQEDYRATAFDVFWDRPFGESNGFTVQAGWIEYDGDVFFPTLPKQSVMQAELGLWIGSAKVQPFLAWAERDYDDPASVDEARYEVGLAWYMKGFERVLKFAYGKIDPDSGEKLDRFTIQLQAFRF